MQGIRTGVLNFRTILCRCNQNGLGGYWVGLIVFSLVKSLEEESATFMWRVRKLFDHRLTPTGKWYKIKNKPYLKPNSRHFQGENFICIKVKPYTKLNISLWGDGFPLGYEALNFLKLPLPLDGYYMLKKIREFFLPIGFLLRLSWNGEIIF